VGRRVQRGQLGDCWEGGGAELPLVATPGEDPGRGRAGLGRRKLTMHALHQPGQAGTPPWAARGRGEGLCAEVGEGYHELRQLSSGAARNEASTLAGGPRTPGGRDPATARHGVDARELYPQRWRRGWPQWPLGAGVVPRTCQTCQTCQTCRPFFQPYFFTRAHRCCWARHILSKRAVHIFPGPKFSVIF